MGLGGSVQIGENLFGIRFGAGIGGSIKTGDQSVIFESISISNSESEGIEMGKDRYLTLTCLYWRKEGKKPTEAFSEIMLCKSTGVKVFSGVIESGNGSDFKSDGLWKSQSYSEKEWNMINDS